MTTIVTLLGLSWFELNPDIHKMNVYALETDLSVRVRTVSDSMIPYVLAWG